MTDFNIAEKALQKEKEWNEYNLKKQGARFRAFIEKIKAFKHI